MAGAHLVAGARRGLVPPLAKAVGGSSTVDAAALARDMRVQRSAYMGLAAAFMPKQLGVWKVGDLHIADLTDGTVKVGDLHIADLYTFSWCALSR